VEKLVDEETSVAKAFVERSSEEGDSRQSAVPGKTQDLSDVTRKVSSARAGSIHIYAGEQTQRADAGQYADTRQDAAQHGDVRQHADTRQGAAQRGDVRQYADTRQGAAQYTDTSQSVGARSQNRAAARKKNKLLAAIVAVVLIFAILLMVGLSVALNAGSKNSYDYNYSKGLEEYNSGNYSQAVEYLEKAAADSQGKKNVELKLKLYDSYIAVGDVNKAVETLKDALTYDKYNEKVLTTLAKYYSDNKDGNALSELLAKYAGTDGEKYLKSYEVDMPTASESSGKYDKVLELELKSVNSYRIYYTTDGSQATTSSKLYSEPIRIEKGSTTVRAVAVNSMGTVSSELELEFEIDYKNPDSPVVTPATGSYGSDTKITITNVPEDGKAFYTLDGTTPTNASEEYTEPISMPEGNIVFSAIIVDSNGMESSVTKRNYNVGVTTKYTYDEAIEHLKVVMMAKEDLNRDGTSADGGQAKFTYYRKTSIANVEMYIAFYDIIKNGVTTRQNYYFGVDIATGKCYKVYDQGGTLIATEY
jgi:tetratricopeptide (TPR) repeat protein